MTVNSAADLRLKHYGTKFIAPATEKAYKAWRNPQQLSLLRVVAAASLPVWTVFPVWAHLGWNIDYLAGYRPYIVGSIIPGLVLGVFIHRTPLQRWPLPLFCLFLAYVSFVSVIVLFLWELQTLGGAVVVAVIYSLWIPFVRVPPLPAVITMSAYMGPLAPLVMRAYENGEISAADGWAYMGSIVAAYVIVGVSSFAIERLTRRAFVGERLLQQQQNQLQKTQLQIRRYLPPAVASQIIEGNAADIAEPQRRRVTVLFSDIVGFTDMADRLDAESLTQILNEYMAAMADIVEQHGGTLNEFTGDGIMSLFGAPQELAPEQQAISAIAAAQAMHRRIPALYQRWRKLGLGEELKIRIGINTGVLSVGSFGSQGRMTYTAIGLQTNIAARIQSHCEPGGILISDATYQLIDDLIACKPKGEVACKGVHYPVKVYAPVNTA